MDIEIIREVRQQCTRFLAGHYRQSPQQVFAELAAATAPDVLPDAYGAGPVIADFEREVADLLGKEAAVFMPSGTMAQQIALRIWSERRHCSRVAFHPTCHLEMHEQSGYRELHGLHGVLVGDRAHLMTLAEVQAITQPLAALLLELPQREIGGQLPDWEELVAITDWARSRDIALHLDGARLWQCKAFYQREYAEIAAHFDTVYVSFYKDFGGIAGAMLAGPADVIAEARVWQRRHGGNLVQLYPYVWAARLGMHKHLPRMGEYVAKAQEIAEGLADLPEIEFKPNLPHTNMMHVYLRGDREALMQAGMDAARETGIFPFAWLGSTAVPNYQFCEWTIGEATLDIPTPEIVAFWDTLIAHTSL